MDKKVKKLIVKHEQYPNPSFKVSPERGLTKDINEYMNIARQSARKIITECVEEESFDPKLEADEAEQRTYELNQFQNEPSSE